MPLAFDPTRIAIVDRDNTREVALVRGMNPATSGSFAYEELGLALIRYGLDIASRTLIVINVIDNVGERWAWSPEAEVFGVDPAVYPSSDWPPYVHRSHWDPAQPIGDGQWSVGSRTGPGEFYWWPFEGLPENTDPEVFLKSPGWDFTGAVEFVDSLYRQSRRAVIYFHCMLGADRTGALHTGYLMRARGMSLTGASRVADSVTSAKGPNADYQRLREAYAVSLKRN